MFFKYMVYYKNGGWKLYAALKLNGFDKELELYAMVEASR